MQVVARFKQQMVRERLDAKSFFQAWDRHNHYKVSPKQFRQVLAAFTFEMSDVESAAITKIFGTPEGDIKYLEFLGQANPGADGTDERARQTYAASFREFSGETDLEGLLKKIKVIVKKNRIRLLEFFQDHDGLRKGYVPFQKFKGVLHTQKVELTDAEYQTLTGAYQVNPDGSLINYTNFNEAIEKVFVEKGLEKAPTKKWDEFKAPSILDPQDVLNDHEEAVLENCLKRIGRETKHRRLLLKPFFQDKDKSNSGFVAATRFRSIFDFMKLMITEAEFETINKRFQAKAPNEINYVEFNHVLKTYSGDDQVV